MENNLRQHAMIDSWDYQSAWVQCEYMKSNVHLHCRSDHKLLEQIDQAMLFLESKKPPMKELALVLIKGIKKTMRSKYNLANTTKGSTEVIRKIQLQELARAGKLIEDAKRYNKVQLYKKEERPGQNG